MSVKYKTLKNNFPAMEKSIKSLNGKRVVVGCLQGDNAWLASIHEYGCIIPVTEKMRKYLAAQGLYLKSTTKVITIPERSFLRSGHDAEINGVMNKADKLVGSVIDGKLSEEQLLTIIGQTLSSKIKSFARNLSNPANSSFTIEQKGSSNPLVDTGQMINSISYEVK